MQIQKQFIHILLIGFTLLIASCGWQLRGYHAAALELDSIALDLEKINNPLFSKTLRDTLANEYQIKVSNSANIKASIEGLTERKRASSKDRGGDVSEYEHTVTLKVSTTVVDADRNFTQSFTNIRRQSYDENNLLSSDIQERTAKVEIYQELTRQYASYLARQLQK